MVKEKYPHNILIVEDEPIMLKTLVDNLSSAGFGNIFTARNGEDGLRMAIEKKPDLVLLDIVMPLMDGMTMLDKLKQNPDAKNSKVILLTNLNANDAIMEGVIKNNPSYYMIKTDHSIDDVIAKVKVSLGIEPL